LRFQWFAAAALVCRLVGHAGEIQIDGDGIFVIDGRRAFPIGFTKAPPPGGRTPDGGDGYAELKSNGDVFHRCGPLPDAELALTLNRSAEAGIHCAVFASERPATELRKLVAKIKDHPGVGYWKAHDEPEWGKVPPSDVQLFYDTVKSLDAKHPVWVTQAPRGTAESLRLYVPAYDVGAIDIYPIGYPPGMHSHFPNKELSVVGDYTRWIRDISAPKPVWMVLQICWSGVTKPGKTLRFPTLPEERYMVYQAIINGARGLVFFGGNVMEGMNDRDRKLGWNWTFYERVLKPVLDEIKPGSPLYPALIAPGSKLPVRAEGVETVVREAGEYIYVLAARREGETVQARFSGLPEGATFDRVLYEEPRKVEALPQGFTDWFAPHEVHVYRFRKP
jgi:hypothetical protein